MSTPQDLDDTTFASTVSRNPLPVLVDFSAAWCPPCKVLAPTIDAVAVEYQGRLAVYKVDIDQAPATSAQFKVMSVPTCVFLRNGKEVDRFYGARDRRAVKELVEKVLAQSAASG